MVTVMGIEKHAAFYRGYQPDDRSRIPVAIVLATLVALWLRVYLASAVGPQPRPAKRRTGHCQIKFYTPIWRSILPLLGQAPRVEVTRAAGGDRDLSRLSERRQKRRAMARASFSVLHALRRQFAAALELARPEATKANRSVRQ